MCLASTARDADAFGRYTPPPVFADVEFRVQGLESDDAGTVKVMPMIKPLTTGYTKRG